MKNSLKFRQIVEKWKIPSNKQYEYESYWNYFNSNKVLLNENNNIKPTINSFGKYINDLIDYIYLFNFIEVDNMNFISKLNSSQVRQLNKNGHQINQSEMFKYTDYKEIITNFYFRKNSSNKLKIRLNFNLLDQKYFLIDKEFYNSNISSIFNELDKYKFEYLSFSFKDQKDINDMLFANITIDVSKNDLLEKSTLWLLNTPWSHLFHKVQDELATFCKNNKLQYHFSYSASAKFINDELKNINWLIIDNFSFLQSNITKLKICSSDKTTSNEKFEKIKINFINYHNEIISLLQKKVELLSILIYLENKLEKLNNSKRV